MNTYWDFVGAICSFSAFVLALFLVSVGMVWLFEKIGKWIWNLPVITALKGITWSSSKGWELNGSASFTLGKRASKPSKSQKRGSW